MSERLCLRCDWTGETEGPACPRCGTPLYHMGRAEPTARRDVGVPAPSRPAPGAPRPHRGSVEAPRGEEWVAPSVAATAGGRWGVIVLAFVIAAAGFAFGLIRRTPPDRAGTRGQLEELPPGFETPSVVGTPSPATTPQPVPPCPDGSASSPELTTPANSVPAPTADYRFQDSLRSEVGTAPDLIEVGRGISAFGDEGMIGRTVLTFARGKGLALTPTTGVIGRTEYTIELLFRFDRLDAFRKIVDFSHGSDDDGLYVFDGCLNFFPMPPGAPTRIEVDSYVQVVLTRDATARVVAYVDGVRQFAFRDTDGLAEVGPSETLRFFVDDSVTSSEYSGGAVSQIRLYDRPLTVREVVALACAELRVPIGARSCPGRP